MSLARVRQQQQHVETPSSSLEDPEDQCTAVLCSRALLVAPHAWKTHPELGRRDERPETPEIAGTSKMAFAKYITVLCLIALANGQAQAPSSVSSEELEQAVTEGVDYLANQVGPHIQAARALQAAIDGGNLTGAHDV